MRAVRALAGRPTLVDVPGPSGEGVVVDVRSAGICGSDLHLLELGFLDGHTIGHEIAGVTPDGTPVAIEPLAPCGACEWCRSGSYHHCLRIPESMYGVSADGGMADRIVVRERSLVALPSGLDPSDACLVEPIAVGVHGLGLAGAVGSDRIAVIGAGSIGLCAAVAAMARGASVDVSARHDHQRAAAERLGAGTEPSGAYDLVVETAGTEDAMRQAVRLVRPSGTILMLSMHWGPVTGVGTPLWLKEVRVLHAMTYCGRGDRRDVDVAADLLATRPGIGEALITHRFPLDAASEAFATAADRASGSIKVVLEP